MLITETFSKVLLKFYLFYLSFLVIVGVVLHYSSKNVLGLISFDGLD